MFSHVYDTEGAVLVAEILKGKALVDYKTEF